jgi:TolA-binding protein
MHILGRCLMRQDRAAEAEPLFAEVYRRVPSATLEPKRAADLMCNWGICLAKLGRWNKAEPALREAQRRLDEAGLQTSGAMREVTEHLAQSRHAVTRPAATSAPVP